MHVETKLPAALWLALFLMAGGAAAAAPDLRLVDAMADRDTARVRALIDEGHDPDTARADGATALLWAAHWGDGEAVELLLRAGADANAYDDHGVTPLARACENASRALVGRLLAAGADPNVAQTNGLTPLMTAARTGSLAVVEALLAHGADVDAATAATHETALMWAVAEGHRDVVRALIDVGADVRPNRRQAFSPLIAAAQNGDIETAEMLLAAGAGVDDTGSDGAHPLAYAVIVGQSAFAHFLLERGADPNGAVDGVTALHAAAGPVGTWLKAWNRQHGGGGRSRAGSRAPTSRLALDERLPLVDALLAKGADPTRHGGLRLPWASRLGSPIEYTKATNQRDLNALLVRYRGKRPRVEPRTDPVEIRRLAQAVERGDTRTIAEIIRSATIAEVKDDNGFTMLCLAARNNQRIVMDTLFGAGTDVNARNEDGSTAGHCGVKHTEIMRELVRRGLDVEATDHAGATALHWTARAGAIETGYLLMEAGARVETKDRSGATPLDWATRAGQDFFRLLIEQAAHSRRQRQ